MFENNYCVTQMTPNGTAQSGGMLSADVSGTPTITLQNKVTETLASANEQGYSLSST